MELHAVVEELRRLGYRMTAQRTALLDAIWSCEGHFTVEQVRAALPRGEPSIDTSTIYRTLDLLCDMGALHALAGSAPTEYERAGEPHHHLLCTVCGKVASLPDYHFDHLYQHLHDEHEFVAEPGHLAITGHCLPCRRASEQGE
jgi:Fur family transcriptional regulator, ferric uptake regulator